ncbi:GNAT family N-acetyltransferase [Clostridium botulinum]|uniref:Acetyltransferase, GNAT family n=1 Tax=Clostridium botulinum (strain Langeland / NCTC 10281 / Type F) TaxID=441772 RepID=A7GBB3_CLOBL|nr:GNAT family N-acetyltransferase [Clostridium botulinum]ABS40239.1 acetyltransferase, GNAT family [Clostridium botulinum F str. Langeland]ADF98543.1 acetyltransferase, GNAT family [Clostridium botulinum F str. 230613]KKM40171.1 acetyltransferase [Clostridium botulinum]MBY6791812.1 GNAT family N-acetyltransferase [Clostridium botulinum]MBY6935819.1 GNAT family N-acetyltransferase [Clostridium botulinum]
MEIIFRKLIQNDLDVFIEMRIKQLQEEGAEPTLDLKPQLYEYYTKHLEKGTFVLWLAVDDIKIVGTSGMSFVEKPAYYSNPYGKIGLLSSMYTLKEYRRKGIDKELLDRVVNEAKDYGCGAVQITASNMGVLLYIDYGFKKTRNS